MSRQSLIRVSVATIGLGLYWAVLFLGTHMPQEMLPPATVNDKLLHCGAFGGLSFLLALAVSVKRRMTWPLYGSLFLLVLAYGAADELTQNFVPGRTADVVDWLADAGGAAAGLVLHRLGVGVLRR